MVVLVLLAVAVLLFRWQGDVWPVVAAKPLLVVLLYLGAISVVFGVGRGGLW